ncbi:MAG: hypothetical protein Q7S36_02475, partial [Candidatus Liptonbacteria bacterium]|nr:hypothetical protein [Candidatus Liptonbacteria bacterium]
MQRIVETTKLHAESPEGKEMNGESLTRRAIQTAFHVSEDDGGPVSGEDAVKNPLTEYTED